MTDYVLTHFGLLEWLSCLEAVVLGTAVVFYGLTRLAAGDDRDDAMLRLYYVFWRAFFAPVTPMGTLDAAQAERVARAAGLAMIGDPDAEQLARLDAPDLGQITADDLFGLPIPDPVSATPAGPSRRPENDSPPPGTTDAMVEVEVEGPAAANAVAGNAGGGLVVTVCCAPDDGQANGIVIERVAAYFGVPPYRVSLIRGHFKTSKTLRIAGLSQANIDARVLKSN